ncbi:phosphohydrolase [Thermosipho melanesiensis]|uniref:CRISPR system single-strand-specific deoxyribonuclease Cas10/Csm1 (subtype III-A) n=2 Tax=Thermosipho melanesiensis TaxID=46541 RepID=A6LNL2_THEM4|nr:type III-A CRISPR-associated protein Cas10/Csm1 [Thermosipho melanesiensis]ABR31513.1 metal dependent phosphohydrolase [Thermosipho melanesiensis BI429]APT74562.1 phosphohydrolase [Thermosipho melanesiensis]OOC35261.1 phosphohydrolase [Thermosipho melanesiensis]OOC35480.1 phosphohydrolase [Thermosipho melanesiensis]OOC36516.1 phosphohydrolase [Thermosipho melanesiensis]
MINLSVEKVFLAGIFHDIGKFYIRANFGDLKKNIYEEYKYFIEGDNKYGPRHQEWGAYFYKNSNLPFKDEIEGAILNHHKPNSVLSKLISVADHISATEREGEHPEDKVKNMKSMLSMVSFSNDQKKGKYKKVSKLSEKFDLLEKEDENVEETYKNLWREFEKVINSIPRNKNPKISFPIFEKIYYILKEYTSNIPSAFFYNEPDISLFSHLSTTAGIAVAIFKQFEEEIKLGNIKILENIDSKNYDEKILGIVKGDISGIQDFLYNISQERAVKKLRGRSFYITYLLEIVAKYIIENEGLSISNILFNGGGHFYLIVPAKTIDKLEKYQKYIDEVMYKAHGIGLNINIAGEKIAPKELNSEIYKRVSQLVERKKYTKLYSLISYDFHKIFESKNLSEDSCPYCRRKMKDDECTFCESFTVIGDRLSKRKAFKLNKTEKIPEKINTYEDVFKMFGYEVEFEEGPFSFLIDKSGNVDLSRYMFYTKSANYISKKENNEISDLETIAKNSNGMEKWGVLRGDVDNLGRIFKEGLGKEASISKTATLSQEIEIFFGKFLEDIVSNEFSNCTVIYSGGDDFFIIGPWSDLPNLAENIQKEFKRYSGDNECISISMGIGISPAKKYPVYRVAKLAGEYLEKAKEYERKGIEKSALGFLGDFIGWEEFEEYKYFKNKLTDLINEKITKRILHVLRRYYQEYDENEGTNKVWKLYYYFAQLSDRYSKSKDKILKFLSEILKDDNKLYNKIYSLTYWVEYELKEG